jgi:haloalkane dehalogenase
MLICWGIHDVVFDRAYLEEWQLRFPDAEVHCFENAGHYVLEDEPEAVLGLIVDFLKRHPI